MTIVPTTSPIHRPHMVLGVVRHDPQQPRPDRSRPLKAAESPVRAHPSFLHDISRVLGRPANHRGRPHRRAMVPTHQLSERFPLTPTSARHQHVVIAQGHVIRTHRTDPQSAPVRHHPRPRRSPPHGGPHHAIRSGSPRRPPATYHQRTAGGPSHPPHENATNEPVAQPTARYQRINRATRPARDPARCSGRGARVRERPRCSRGAGDSRASSLSTLSSRRATCWDGWRSRSTGDGGANKFGL